MKDYLFNLALIETIEYCHTHNIDPSGTHLYKYPRKQTYALVRDTDSRALVTVTFYKNSVPTFTKHNP